MKDARKSPSIVVRMPEELMKWFKHQAVDNRRSLSGELLYCLEEFQRQQLQKGIHAQT